MRFFFKTLSTTDDRVWIRFGIHFLLWSCLIKFVSAYFIVQQEIKDQDRANEAHAITLPIRDMAMSPSLQDFLKQHPVYLSMTTTPERIQYVTRVLASIDTSLVNTIFVVVPQVFARTGQTYQIPDDLQQWDKVHIIRPKNDHGPISKLLPTLELIQERKEDAILITIDDDYIYPRGTIYEHVYHLYQAEGRHATASIIGVLGNQSNMPYAYRITDASLQQVWPDRRPQLLHGVGSIGMFSQHMDSHWLREILQYEASHGQQDCRLSDDLLISIGLRLAGVEFTHIQSDYLSHALLQPMRGVTEVGAIHNISVPAKDWTAWLYRGKVNAIEERLDRCFTMLNQYQKDKKHEYHTP